MPTVHALGGPGPPQLFLEGGLAVSADEESDLTKVSNEHLEVLTFDAIIDRDTGRLDELQAEWFRRAERSRQLGELSRDHSRKPRR